MRSTASYPRFAAVLLAGLVMSTGAAFPGVAQKAKPALADLFDVGRELVLHGTAEVPVFSVTDPLIARNHIYLADFLGHRLLEFDARGRFVRAVGSRGTGAGQFQLPYTVASDRTGRIYVNDRGNNRVQVFDADLRPTATLRMFGQDEQLIVMERGGTSTLLVQGVVRCADKRSCLLTQLGLDGHKWSYAPVDTNAVISTWKMAVSDDGTVYMANVLGDSATVYAPSGERVRSFSLQSPTVLHLTALRPANTRAQTASLLVRLKQARYTAIRRVTVSGRSLFVQFELVNAAANDVRYALDVYDVSGCLLYAGVPTPGLLASNGNSLYFVRRDETGHGSLAIRPVRVKRTKPTSCHAP